MPTMDNISALVVLFYALVTITALVARDTLHSKEK